MKIGVAIDTFYSTKGQPLVELSYPAQPGLIGVGNEVFQLIYLEIPFLEGCLDHIAD